jgi:hypothetical protein
MVIATAVAVGGMDRSVTATGRAIAVLVVIGTVAGRPIAAGRGALSVAPRRA